MTTATPRERVSLLEYVHSQAELVAAHDVRGVELQERRNEARYAPCQPIVVRLDVLGGVWSAKVINLSDSAAQLGVDRGLADRVSADEPASVVFESPMGHRSRLSGRLRIRHLPAADPRNDRTAMTLTFEEQAIEPSRDSGGYD